MEGSCVAYPQGLHCEQLCADGEDRACLWGWWGCECLAEEEYDGVGGGLGMKDMNEYIISLHIKYHTR